MHRENRPLHVLAVDDEPIILLGTVSMLESLGCRVTRASCGQSALAALTADPSIAAIVTDQTMPGLSGLELIGAAQQLHRPLAFVLTTGHIDLAPGPAAAWTHIVKPFSCEELAVALDAAMDAAHPALDINR